METQEEKNIKLVGVYGRVSTSNQENEGTIETQLSAVREFAKKNNYTIIKDYLDDGWSGDSIVRPALDQLRMDAKNKMWEAVLVYDPDRLARRYSYQELIMDELEESGIEVLFVTIGSPKNDEDKLMYGMRGLFSQYERTKISERFRLGKLRKVKEGHVLTTEAPYGYTYIRGNRENKIHGYYEINPEEARIVKNIFSWIADEGLTIRAVVRRLQNLAIKPKKSKRGVWNTSSIINMLGNKSYIGEAHWGKSYAVIPERPINKEKYRKMKKSSRRVRPEEEWYIIPVPAIIDKILFDRTHVQLKKNAALCSRNRKHQYLLSGKIFCKCGTTRSGAGPRHGKYLYYRCNDRIYSFPLSPRCKEGFINARIADKLVWDKIYTLMSSPELMLAQAKRWLCARQDKTKYSTSDVKTLEKEAGKLKLQEDRYNKAYGAGAFTVGQLKEYNTPLQEKITALELQIAKSKQEENQIDTSTTLSIDEIKAFAEEATKKLTNLNFETKRAIIMNVIDKIIGTQQSLEVYGYLPVSHAAYETSHRYSRASECGKINPFQSPDQKTS